MATRYALSTVTALLLFAATHDVHAQSDDTHVRDLAATCANCHGTAGRAQAPLPVLASKAISLLSSDPQGFFLVIEHEGVDGASHNNANENVVASLRSLDTVVGEALDFAAADGKTLVIVIGDHETGGLSLAAGEGPAGVNARWGTKDHTGGAVPVFAFGPGAAEFSGMIDNTDIAKKLFALME